MKPTAVTLITIMLIEILVPGFSIAAQELQGEETDGVDWPKAAGSIQSRQRSEEDRAAQNAARIIRSLYEMDVWVMSRRHLDLSKVTKGFYSHVIHRKEGASGTATGVIFDNYPDGIGIKSTSTVPKKEKVLYADIDTLVVAKDRRALERWQRRAQGRFLIMSQGNLDLSKLKKGWHAYLVYKFEDGTRARLTKITDIDAEHVVIRSNYAGGDQFWADGRIAHDDIVIVVAAENRGDITGWRHARQVIRHLPLNPRIRFNASRSANRGSDAKSLVGRLLDVSQDTLVIGVGLSRHEVFRVPIYSIDNFEINIGRNRNTIKGLGIGFLLGLGVLAPVVYVDAKSSGRYRWLRTVYTGFCISLPIVALSTLIGAGIESDRWVDVPIKGLNVNVDPSKNRGLGAAVSFEF